jgi:non-ribosomal peptide synthase protein (TIGR01720 family)
VKQTKEQLRRIPDKGIGYGVLRYLSREKEIITDPEISFNYLGEFGQDSQQEGHLFRFSDLPSGETISPLNARAVYIDINGAVSSGRLSLGINYNPEAFEEECIERLCELYRTSLSKIIAHCAKKEHVEITPSDLIYNRLSVEQLDDLSDELSQIID